MAPARERQRVYNFVLSLSLCSHPFARSPTKLLRRPERAVGVAVAERLHYSPPTKANRVQSRAGSLRICASGNLAGQLRWSTGFLGDLPFHPLLHSSAAPFSPHFSLIGSQHLSVKTLALHRHRVDKGGGYFHVEIPTLFLATRGTGNILSRAAAGTVLLSGAVGVTHLYPPLPSLRTDTLTALLSPSFWDAHG
ncbi:hypothetical protein PR048_031879 [Dryococelus australis]|uniref:Uncharacterized protein n=1 Tax=Dryococelus australis TaxID=614101 RepID=A0ABQ9G6J9_9NEOP|nr:hypothetical protein PR048_031879 [Dryococelus australis]